MKKKSRKVALLVALMALMVVAVVSVSADGFTHAPVIMVDGEEYYMAGAPDGPDGATDIPGHEWVQAGPNQVQGKHYNTGPFDKMPQWWTSDADDGELLFIVHGIIDTWSPEKAAEYAAKGYVHRHELRKVNADGSAGAFHPNKVVWLKHTARTSFDFDGGPHPEYRHDVTPGVDYEFIMNGFKPYPEV